MDIFIIGLSAVSLVSLLAYASIHFDCRYKQDFYESVYKK
nr:MAG TPA: hypothetical protein [Caudoviricetes sp.]